MSERVKAYRARQRAAGLSQVSLWLDAPTVQLLKQAAEARQQLPGEIVAVALQTWWAGVDHAPPSPADKREPKKQPEPVAPAVPDISLLRGLVHHMVQEELTAIGAKKIPLAPPPIPPRTK
ncbi:MAG: hypothetical protein HQL90_03140 [Magnetococcales bacterium]|nr:hypothetical protein [Magnetococcales bacterium]